MSVAALRRPVSHVVARPLLALLGIVVVLVALELGLRLALGQRVDYDRAYWTFHPWLGRAHPPHLDVTVPFAEHPEGYFRLVTNNHGLREDADSSYEKLPGVSRILAMGDSHTDGTVNNVETYPNVLEAELVQRGERVEVLNVGVAGYSPFTELLWYHLYGRLYQPEVVMVGLYVGNDLRELGNLNEIAISGEGSVLVDGKALQPRKQPVSDKLKDWLQRSYLYQVAQGGLDGLKPAEELSPPQQAVRVCRGCYWQSLNQSYRFGIGEVDLERAMARLENVLVEFQQQVEVAGGRLIVMVIPTKRQVETLNAVEGERFERAADILEQSPEDRDPALRVREWVLALCERNELEALDLLPGLRARFESERQVLYYSTDWHLNPAGHQAVAELMAEYLLGHVSTNPDLGAAARMITP